jgi:hypothetical protein
VLEKGQQIGPRQMLEAESRDGPVSTHSDESQKQAPGIAICQYRPVRGITLLDQPFVKEGVQQLRERGELVFRHQ